MITRKSLKVALYLQQRRAIFDYVQRGTYSGDQISLIKFPKIKALELSSQSLLKHGLLPSLDKAAV